MSPRPVCVLQTAFAPSLSAPMHKALIGFHASHEQFSPARLLRCVQQAEQAGFKAAMCSDHFHPWSERQKHSSFAWSWLGSALEATSFRFGTVCAPGQRYHPAVIAQAAATLAEMYPGRFWIAVGSGENLNEHITGAAWPAKSEREARLQECVEVMRALWAGETVSHDGRVCVCDEDLQCTEAISHGSCACRKMVGASLRMALSPLCCKS